MKKRVRVRKEDSAFLYAILESYGDIVSFSTVDYKPGLAYRDIELSIPPDFVADVNRLLAVTELGEIIYELPPDS